MACNIVLSGIAYDCGVNLAGIRNLYIADWNDVDGKPTVSSIIEGEVDTKAEHISAITMKSGKKFQHYVFAKNTASLTKTLTKNEETGVKYYTNELVANFNHMDDFKRRELEQLDGGQLAVIAEDQNGHYWYLGFANYATASAVTGQTGAGADDGNFYALTITDISGKLPYTVDPDVVAGVIAE